MKKLENLELTELSYQELTTIEGGAGPLIPLALLPVLGLALQIAIVGSSVFYAGYFIGNIIF
ncbi:hypothetical protein BH09BAC3_BH09BAC3_20310 [soil metagenome]